MKIRISDYTSHCLNCGYLIGLLRRDLFRCKGTSGYLRPIPCFLCPNCGKISPIEDISSIPIAVIEDLPSISSYFNKYPEKRETREIIKDIERPARLKTRAEFDFREHGMYAPGYEEKVANKIAAVEKEIEREKRQRIHVPESPGQRWRIGRHIEEEILEAIESEKKSARKKRIRVK